MGKIVKRHYIRITFKTASPLLIGSSSSSNTDCDVLRDSRNEPYIPGTSVAGVVREAMETENIDVSSCFGFLVKNDGSGESNTHDSKGIGNSEEASRRELKNNNASEEATTSESKVIFHDAVLKEKGKYTVSIRDHVCLDDFKTAVEGAKFDTEVVEAGVGFVTFIEQNCMENDEDILETIAKLFINNKVAFGAETVHGFGRITDVCVWKKSFDLKKAEDAIEWLSFDPCDDELWGETLILEESGLDACSLNLELELTGGISIRRYTTEVGKEKEAVPDYRQLTALDENGDSVPVIPGSSWSGAIQHRIASFGTDLSKYTWIDNGTEHKGDYFGFVIGNDKMKSQVSFSESRIKGGADKVISRNAIDRFSGGTINGALFTEKMHYGGTCTLRIEFSRPKNGSYSQQFINAFAAALSDLHNGYLAVGGLTAVGRGIFRIRKVDGDDLDDQNVYPQLQKKLNMINDQFKEVKAA